MIKVNDKYEFSVEEHFIGLCTVGPWFNETIFWNLYGPIFEELFFTTCQDRYDQICGLHVYEK